MADLNLEALMNLPHELRTYLDTLTITGENIGEIRRSLFLPWDSAWNGLVREETAAREGCGAKPRIVCACESGEVLE